MSGLSNTLVQATYEKPIAVTGVPASNGTAVTIKSFLVASGSPGNWTLTAAATAAGLTSTDIDRCIGGRINASSAGLKTGWTAAAMTAGHVNTVDASTTWFPPVSGFLDQYITSGTTSATTATIILYTDNV